MDDGGQDVWLGRSRFAALKVVLAGILFSPLVLGCAPFKAAGAKLARRLVHERHTLEETCAALETGDPGSSSAHALTQTGRRVLRRDPIETALALVRMAQEAQAAAVRVRDDAVESVPEGCGWRDLEPLVREAADGHRQPGAPGGAAALNRCSAYYFKTLPEALEPLAPRPLRSLPVELRQDHRDRILPWAKVGSALANSSLPVEQMLGDPVALADAIDLSSAVVGAAVRLGQVLHARIDSVTASIPYVGGVVGAVTERIGAELLAWVADALVARLEQDGWAHRADVGRRACQTIERDDNHPTIVYRTLVRLILRFRYDEVEVPPAEIAVGATSKSEEGYAPLAACGTEDRRDRRACKRTAKRFGLQLELPPVPPRKAGSRRYARQLRRYLERVSDPEVRAKQTVGLGDGVPRFARLEPAKGGKGAFATRAEVPGVDEELSGTGLLTHLDALETKLAKATDACSTVEDCTLAVINRQLIIFMEDGDTYEIHVHEGVETDDCVKCCGCEASVSFTPAPAESSVVVAIDSSVSVHHRDPLPKMKDMVRHFTGTDEALRVREGAVFKTGTDCAPPRRPLHLDPSSAFWKAVAAWKPGQQRKARTEARPIFVGGRPLSDGTPLRGAIKRGVEALRRAAPGLRVLILISDGFATCLGRDTSLAKSESPERFIEAERVLIEVELRKAREAGVQVQLLHAEDRDADHHVDMVTEFCGTSLLTCYPLASRFEETLEQALEGARCRVPVPKNVTRNARLTIDGVDYPRVVDGANTPQWSLETDADYAVVRGDACKALLRAGSGTFVVGTGPG